VAITIRNYWHFCLLLTLSCQQPPAIKSPLAAAPSAKVEPSPPAPTILQPITYKGSWKSGDTFHLWNGSSSKMNVSILDDKTIILDMATTNKQTQEWLLRFDFQHIVNHRIVPGSFQTAKTPPLGLGPFSLIGLSPFPKRAKLVSFADLWKTIFHNDSL
jgi:hypothetical protein